MKGYTLLELLLILTLVALSFFLIVGLNQHLWIKNQIITTQSILANIVQFSRNAALEEGHEVTLNAFKNSDDWSSGVLLFQDNQVHQYTGDETILHQWSFNLSPQIYVRWKGFQSDQYIVFSPNLRRSTSNGHFDIYHQGRLMSTLIVNRLGTTRIKESAHDKIH